MLNLNPIIANLYLTKIFNLFNIICMICNLCPRQCNVDRSQFKGFCGESEKIKIAKYCLFNFEEPLISGKNGSGAIFFCGCSLKCVFCQNYDISSLDKGKEITVYELAQIFKYLETNGAENINLVNPTHYVKQIIEALKIYRPSIPIVYNTHGYEKIETLKMLAPYIDVYLPDFKYFDNFCSKKYSNCSDYVDVVKAALKFMREQGQDIVSDGVMKKGMIVRHLIMPLMTDQSIAILNWIKRNLNDTLVSLMAQYTPYGRADQFKEINRKITKREYQKVVDAYIDLNLNGFVQDRESANVVYIPKWDC